MNFYGYYVLNLRPTVLAFIGAGRPIPEWLHPSAVIEHIPWWHGSFRAMLGRKLKQLRTDRRGLEHRLMVHAPDEDLKRTILRVNGAQISQNIYINTKIFRPLDTPKTLNAIYIAQLKRFKRLHLAREIQPPLLIVASDLTQKRKYQRLLPNACFNEHPLTKAEVASSINSAFCTLALSKTEGAMLASFESLLCGVPVVSTPSRGGRDVFFDDYNSRIADASPGAIGIAVDFFRETRPDPSRIRAKALADLEKHRIRFCGYVSDLVVQLGGARTSPHDRYQRYFATDGELSDLFLWANKLESPDEVRRIHESTIIG